MMGIWSETQECEECGRTYTSTLYDLVTDNGNTYGECCSKRCFERSWAATMDGYDVDDPNNPMYSSPASSGDGCLVDILLLFFTSVLVLGLIALSEIALTYAYKKFFKYLLPESLEPNTLIQFISTDYKLSLIHI